jgi:uncharacterized protein YaaW (UPF0174 family)
MNPILHKTVVVFSLLFSEEQFSWYVVHLQSVRQFNQKNIADYLIMDPIASVAITGLPPRAAATTKHGVRATAMGPLYWKLFGVNLEADMTPAYRDVT